MSTLTLSPPTVQMQQQVRVPYRITVDQYLRMVQASILGKYDRCVLLEGILVAKVPRSPQHDGALHCLNKKFWHLLSDTYQPRNQMALVLDDSVPEPDIVVVRGDARAFSKHHPNAGDACLVIEVADSSLALDRDAARIYARNRVPIYWIVNVVDNIIEVYTQPSGPTEQPGYASRQDYTRSDSIPLILDGNLVTTLAVVDLLA